MLRSRNPEWERNWAVYDAAVKKEHAERNKEFTEGEVPYRTDGKKG
jgi:hypothetical protein